MSVSKKKSASSSGQDNPGRKGSGKKHVDERFSTLFDFASDAIFILDLEGNFIDVNQAAHARLGYTKDELLSMHVSMLQSPAFRDTVAEKLALIREQGQGLVVSEHVRKDGTIMPVEINARVIEYCGEKVIFSIIRDVTERKRTEEARVDNLLINESRLKQAQQIAHLGDWEWDVVTNQVFWSDELFRIYGYQPHEISPDYGLVVNAMHPDSKKEFLEAIDAALKGQRPFEMDYTFFRNDGSVAILHTIGKVTFDANGKPARMAGIVQDITEQKRAQEAIRESEEKFRSIFNTASDGILIADLSAKRFSSANTTICNMLGYTREELLNLGVADIHPANELSRVLAEFDKQARGEKKVAENVPVLKKDGGIFYADISTTSILLDGERHAIGIFRDITERRIAEQALREANEKLNAILQASPAAIYILDEQGVVTMWNKAAENMFGWSAEEAVGRVHPIVQQDKLDEFRAYREKVLRGEPLLGVEASRRKKDGTPIEISISAAPLYDSAGTANGLMSVVTDITERKKMEEALRSSRDFIERILNTVDEAFIVIDRDYRIIKANNAYALQASMSLQDILGKHCHEISHRNSKPCFESGEECAVNTCFATGEPHSCVHKHVSKDGSTLFVETKAFPLKDAAGHVTSAIEVINNITDKHLLEEQLLRTQKLEAVGLLAGGIAHDFNNLLQGIFGSISMAKTFSDRSGKAFAMLEGAEAALYQAKSLTKQLLTFSKGGEPVKKVVALPGMVDNAVKFALSGSNVIYQSTIDADLWTIEADEGQISQVLHNIVLNACDAMPAGGTIRIETRNAAIDEKSGLPLNKGNYVRIAITDSGSGIPEDHVSRIFDPYFTTKPKGNGLGLATSYSIIKKHDGIITVRSQPGAGSTFCVYLPASTHASAPANVQSPALITGKGRILVMDDEDIVRAVADYMLTSLGYEAVFVENGAQAIEQYAKARATKKPFDVIILDLTIRGGMGGKEALKTIAEMDPKVKAVVSSGYSADDILSQYREHGFQAVLSKPYEIEVLSRVLDQLIRNEEPA